MKVSQTSDMPIWRQAVSLFFLPAIGAYMLGYWVQGVHCTYRLGNFDVTPLEPVTARQYWLMRFIPTIGAVLAIVIIMAIGYALGAPLN